MKPRHVIFPIGPSIAYVPLTKGQFSLIDRERGNFVGKSNWYAYQHPKMKYFYAFRHVRNEDGSRSTVGMHREILGLSKENLEGDHVNGNTLDNRDINLRRATRSENQRNTKKSSYNSSGFKGVSFSKRKRKYHAYIKINRQNIHLGYFDAPEEAHAAYRAAAHVYHGEFARVA